MSGTLNSTQYVPIQATKLKSLHTSESKQIIITEQKRCLVIENYTGQWTTKLAS